ISICAFTHRDRKLAQTGLSPRAHVVRWLSSLGPGIVTGAADDDPSGIATYSIAGATAGFTLLWTALITTPMMAVLMGMCARIGLVTDAGLVTVLKRTFNRHVVLGLVVLVTLANTLNIAADYAGMAASARLVLPLPEIVWIVGFAAALIAVEVFFTYRAFARIIEWLCLSLLAYVVTAFIVHPHWPTVLLAAIVPHFEWNGLWLTTLLAVLGTTITPYLFIWQNSMYLEEVHARARKRPKQPIPRLNDALSDAHADVNAGMGYSNLMTFFIIVTTAATLGAHHLPIATAQDAALALRPLAGNFASLLFALGIVGTGLLAIPVIAGSSAYALADFFSWRDSLNDKPRQAPLFYLIIVLGLVGGMAMASFHLDPMKMLLYSAAFNGIAVVPLIYFVLRVSRMESVLGKRTSSASALWIGWAAFALMAVSSILAIYSWVHPA
ncbi:MAG TPA: divalent metal cation transporter, partial [Candidatus Baltobacteraceae bacterium]|nr:divalent metal cation transporter [Candidatus Baltobacteraceae bacterium]